MLFERIQKIVFATGLLVIAVPVWGQRGPGSGMGQLNNNYICQTLIDSLPRQSIDAAETEALVYMREEEKLARDVYAQLFGKWGSPVFANISQSEQRHFDSLELLLDRYGLADPAANNAVGIFSNPGLQTLYGDLVKMGSESMVAALQVGAMIEDLDIRDLDKALAGTDNSDLTVIYQNLQKGSRNHLRAFVGRLNALGETYAAQYISAAALAEILASPHESGTGNGAGNSGPGGLGRGNGTCIMGNACVPAPGAGTRRPW